jgi:hypothetical protein
MEKIRHMVSHRRHEPHNLYRGGDYAGAAMTAPATTGGTPGYGGEGTQFYEAPRTAGAGTASGGRGPMSTRTFRTTEPRAQTTAGPEYGSLDQPAGKPTVYQTGGEGARTTGVPSQKTSSAQQPSNLVGEPTEGPTQTKNLRFDGGQPTAPVYQPREQYPVQSGRGEYLQRDATTGGADTRGVGVQDTGQNVGATTGYTTTPQKQQTGYQLGPESPVLGRAGQGTQVRQQPSQGYREQEVAQTTTVPRTEVAPSAAGDAGQRFVPEGAIVGPHSTYAANKLDPAVNTSAKTHVENAHLHSRSRGGGDYAADKFHKIIRRKSSAGEGETSVFEQLVIHRLPSSSPQLTL